MYRNYMTKAMVLLTIVGVVMFSFTTTGAQTDFPRITFIDPYWVHVNDIYGDHNTKFSDSLYYYPQMKRCEFTHTVTNGDNISLNYLDSLFLLNANLGSIYVNLYATGVENEYPVGGIEQGESYFQLGETGDDYLDPDGNRLVFRTLSDRDSAGVVFDGTFPAGDQPYSWQRTYRFIFTMKMDGDTSVVDTVARVHIWETAAKSENYYDEHGWLMSRDLWGEEGEKFDGTFYIFSNDFSHPGEYEDIDLGTISLDAWNKNTHIEFKWLGTRDLYIDDLWVRDNWNYQLFVSEDPSNTYQWIQNTLESRYNINPALTYRFYVDEPRANMYHSYGKVDSLSQERPGVSLNGATMPVNKKELAAFVDAVGPTELLYNHYTIMAETDTATTGESTSLQNAWYRLISEPRGDSYRGMRAASIVADSYGIPFYMTIQACNETRLNDTTGVWECWYRAPTRNELLCEAHLALCYGAKGIMYFTYPAMKDSTYYPQSMKYSGTKYYGLVDLVDANGDSTWDFHTGRYVPNYRWYAAQEINTKIDSLDDVLLNLDWIAAFVSKPDSIVKYATFVEGLTSEEFGTDTSYIEVGEFWHTYEGANYLMLVNRRCLSSETQTVTVWLDTDAYMIQDAYNHDVYGSADGVFAGITLAPGEGRLFKLVSSDATWTGAINVHSSVTVPQGVRLTVESGATVKFAPNSVLQINGGLHARGSDSNYISFISIQPAQQWSGILFADSSEDSLCLMKKCFIGYAGTGIACMGASPDTINNILFHQCDIGIACENASPHICSPIIYTPGTVSVGIYCSENSAPSIDSVEFCGNGTSGSIGIRILGSNPVIRGGTISKFARGIDICGGDPVISGVRVKDNTEYGIACNESGFPTLVLSNCDSSSPTVTGNTITGSQRGLFTGSLCEAYIAGNVVDSNQVGMCSDNSSSVVYGNRIILNDSIGVYCSGTNLPCLGDLGNADSTDDGYNQIWGHLKYEVLNEAADTVQAENNWWGRPDPQPGQFSGLVDYEPFLETAPDSTSPVVVEDLCAWLVKVPSANGLLLEWSAVSTDVEGYPEQVAHYAIYRDTIPYFEASEGKILTEVPDTVLEYFDSGVVGDVSVNYYYVVKAVDYGSNESAASDQVGEFDKFLTKVKGKHPDGFNLVSWPLIVFDSDIQAVFADSLGMGCQLTGGYPALNADRVQYKDLADNWSTGWYKVGGPESSYVWKGSLATVEPSKGYWVKIKGGHPAVILAMSGKVNTETQYIPVAPGPTETLVGTCWPVPRPLSGATGDDCGLLASGFTGANGQLYSDMVRHFEVASWYTAWYRTTGTPSWRGTLGPGQAVNDPVMQPGSGYAIQLREGHAFVDDQWVYPPPSEKMVAASKSRPTMDGSRREVSKDARRALGPSTNRSLDPKKEVEISRTR